MEPYPPPPQPPIIHRLSTDAKAFSGILPGCNLTILCKDRTLNPY
jgi:hypothetical protein